MSHEQETLHQMVNLGKGHYSIVKEHSEITNNDAVYKYFKDNTINK